jgi:CheY-like chemotaxis protein
MMDGDIRVDSEPGRGSTFTFRVKIKRSRETEKGLLKPGINWNNLRVLVVDDANEVREYFGEMAEGMKFFLEAASNGEEALALIEKNGLYDIYFVDWKMPGMNGVELCRRIKEKGGASVVIMISAAQFTAVEAEAKAAGVDKFLPKPIFPSAVADCIGECLGQGALTVEPGRRREKGEKFRGERILLAEDVEINREIVISLLEPFSLVIDCAENGIEAVKLFTEHPEKYDMIFMDVQMPEMDGYAATRLIRAFEEERRKEIAAEHPRRGPQGVPIVAMTANVFREDIEKCLAAGMNAHVGKPLDLDEVLATLRVYLPSGR